MCVEGPEYQPTNDEHRHRVMIFGYVWHMVGGSTNKLTAAGFDQVDKMASTFNAAKFLLVLNNSTGANKRTREVRKNSCIFDSKNKDSRGCHEPASSVRTQMITVAKCLLLLKYWLGYGSVDSYVVAC